MNNTRITVLISQFLVLLVLIRSPTSAQCTVSNNRSANYPAAFINEDPSASHLAGAISQGAAAWNSTACNISGIDFPIFSTSGSGEPAITVRMIQGAGPEGPYGFTNCGSLESSTNRSYGIINLYTSFLDPQGGEYSCQNDVPHSGLVKDRITHELGHYLGLGHASPSCGTSYIMTPDFVQPVGSTYVFLDKSLNANECRAADQQSQTPVEEALENNEGPPGDSSDGSTANGGGSPILLDLDMNSFHLSSLDDGVIFDIDNDGQGNLLSWTSASEWDAFLAFDRNGNGLIDDASELFGDSTPLLLENDVSEHGFIALAEFDSTELGGNGDGLVDRLDWNFPILRAWIDWDHDATTDTGEMLSLSEAGIVAISLGYRENRRTDLHGNELRFKSRAWIDTGHGPPRPTWAVDVFFVVAE